MARSRLHRQNATRSSPTTPYNANTHSSPGGALTNTNTSTTDSGSTATPPRTRSINTLDHNQRNTCHYRFKDSRRGYLNTRDNRHHPDHKPAKHQPRVACPEPPTTQTQAAPSTNTNNTHAIRPPRDTPTTNVTPSPLATPTPPTPTAISTPPPTPATTSRGTVTYNTRTTTTTTPAQSNT